jgi:hypothetical protein
MIMRPADIPAEALVRLNDVIEWTRRCKLSVDVVEGPVPDSANAFRRWEGDRLVKRIAREISPSSAGREEIQGV